MPGSLVFSPRRRTSALFSSCSLNTPQRRMEEALYHLHFQQEESHWWFAARSEIVRHVIERHVGLSPGDTILDVGCGTGAILSHLSKTYRTVGIDMSPLAIEYSRRRGLTDVLQIPVEQFPAADYNVKAAIVLDVIEHIEDDIGVLGAIRNIIGPSGRVLITVPAHPWLWSAHDVANHHVRRYTKKTLRESLLAAGLEPVRMNYYNSILFPLGVVRKFLDRRLTADKVSEHLSQPGRVVNGLLRRVFAFEKWLVMTVPLPWGISLMTIARPIRHRGTDTNN